MRLLISDFDIQLLVYLIEGLRVDTLSDMGMLLRPVLKY